MSNNISIINSSICTGCGACHNSCPTNAITMQPNQEGFLYPIISSKDCISCGKCLNSCPVISYKNLNFVEPKCFAIMARDDIRMKSSSGGMFYSLASYALSLNGYVCGTRFNSDFTEVNHVLINKFEDLDLLCKAKYVQSITGDVFKKIKSLLDQNIFVFYCGCPCQVAGLYSFLGIHYENLLTADLLCHGANSPLAFHSYLKEKANGRVVSKIDFRGDKNVLPWGSFMSIYYRDLSSYYCRPCTEDSWYIGFLEGYTRRTSCSSCQYSKHQRVGDFSLGDFWGIDTQFPTLNDTKGVSLVLINNNKASKVLNSLKVGLKAICSASLSGAATYNQVLEKPYPTPAGRPLFFSNLPSLGYHRSLTSITNKYDVGIIGFWGGSNYGSCFTYFALASTIQDLGFTVLLIREPYTNPCKIPINFMNKYFNISKHYKLEQLHELNNMCSTFVLGSDQVFVHSNIKGHEMQYLLLFADDSKKKIAISSSFGFNKILFPENQREVFNFSLSRFDSISVREFDGVELCASIGIKASFLIDPVFLCEKNKYELLASKSKKELDTPYLLAYILDPNPEKREALLFAANKLGLSLKIILAGMDVGRIETDKRILNLPDNLCLIDEMEDWFFYFCNASFVMTDSFHGTCISIILNKNFVSFENSARGKSRTDTLNILFNIRSHICYNPKDILNDNTFFNPIDFSFINTELSRLRPISISWIKKSLSAIKSKK